MAKYNLKVAHFYGDLMNTYGDIGNIIALKYYGKQMDTDITSDIVSIGDDFNDQQYDLAVFGVGQEYEQMVVSKDIPHKKEAIARFINGGKPFLAICGGFQLLGQYYVDANGEKIPGIGVLSHYTVTQSSHRSAMQNQTRFIGDIVIKNPQNGDLYHGFENHNGRTFLGDDEQPLGIVQEGHGNNGEDKTEGAIYKHTYCSYFHGPILTRNGNLAKQMLLEALHNKYPNEDFSKQESLIIKPTF